MALQMSVSLTNNFAEVSNFSDAYIVVDKVSGTKLGIEADILVKKSKDGMTLEKRNIAFVPSTDDSSSNFIKQVYEFLKTDPEYSKATDV